jgi:hypothetical protein
MSTWEAPKHRSVPHPHSPTSKTNIFFIEHTARYRSTLNEKPSFSIWTLSPPRTCYHDARHVADASEATFAKLSFDLCLFHVPSVLVTDCIHVGQNYSRIMPLSLKVLRNVNGADYRKLRVKAMECTGLIGPSSFYCSGDLVYWSLCADIAVGLDIFRPDAKKIHWSNFSWEYKVFHSPLLYIPNLITYGIFRL